MNYSLTILEMAVIALGLGLLLLDLWTPAEQKRQLGYVAAAALGFVLLFSFSSLVDSGVTATAFNGMYVQDDLALFFKRFFLLAAILVQRRVQQLAELLDGGYRALAPSVRDERRDAVERVVEKVRLNLRAQRRELGGLQLGLEL